jgi:DNA-binding MurR/RpiR family transcriptional regulator
MSASSVLITIRTNYDRLTKLEKKVADYVLNNPKAAVKMTINELAASSGVGDTTVFRFCRSLDLAGYQDFKLSLALSADPNEMLDGKENLNVAESHDLHELAQKVSIVFRDTVSETFASLDYDAISRTVDAIMNANAVYLYGFGSSGIAALTMQNRFMRILPNTFYSSDAHMQLTSASLLQPGSLAIIFCNSGMTKDSLRIAEMSHRAGATTIFVTKFPQSPAAAFSDIILVCGAAEGPIQGGSIASVASQLCLISLIYSELFRRMGDRAKESKIKTSRSLAEKKL